jgi:hypothetical protein
VKKEKRKKWRATAYAGGGLLYWDVRADGKLVMGNSFRLIEYNEKISSVPGDATRLPLFSLGMIE